MNFKKSLIVTCSLLMATQAFATMTPTFERGEKNVYHNSDRGIQEVCVIPSKYPDAKYTSKDLKKEIDTCNVDFYTISEEEKAQGMSASALCPKTNSTNPGVNIFEIDEEKNQSKVGLEKIECKDAEKIGKYKNSTSCSYTPGILAYYHVSRILGNIGRVPVSVLRSMDVQTHKKIARHATEIIHNDLLIYQTWSGLLASLNSGLASKYKDMLLSDDGEQSYGAFILNPKSEIFYSGLFNNGTDRPAAFRDKNAYFGLVRNQKPLNQLVSNKWSQANFQNLFAMKDASEFVLLDHLLSQQDRFGNIAAQPVTVYRAKNKVEDQNFDLKIKNDAEDYAADKAAGLVDLTVAPISLNMMVLKDNDCAVSKNNAIKNAGLLRLVRHMDPKTYQHLLKFQQTVTQNNKFFTANLMFTQNDYNVMVANINDAANILKANCKAGLLQLDLDVEHYIETGSLNIGTCEMQ